MSKRDDEYKMILIITVISGSMCIVMAMIGMLSYIYNPSILEYSRNKIKNIYTIQNVILHKEETI